MLASGRAAAQPGEVGADALWSETLALAGTLPTDGSRAGLLRQYAQRLTGPRRDSAVHRLAAELADLLPEGYPREREVSLELGRVLVDELGAFERAKAPLYRALELADSAAAPAAYLATLDVLAKAHYRLHEQEAVVRLADLGDRLADRHALSDYRVRFAQWMGRAEEVVGRTEAAYRLYRRTDSLAAFSADDRLRYDAGLNLAVTSWRLGRPREGLEQLAGLQALASELDGAVEHLADLDLWRGIMLQELGEHAEALRLYARIAPVYDSLGILYRQTHVRMQRAKGYLETGTPAATVTQVEEAFAIAGDRITVYERIYGHDLLHYAHERLGDDASALANLRLWNLARAEADSVNDAQATRQLVARYEQREQARTIEQQQAAIASATTRRRLLTGLLALASLAAVALALLARRLAEARRRAEGFAAELASARDELAEALTYQQSLLREMHHRVFNNLQVVVSLLELERERADDQRTRGLLAGVTQKIYSVAAVHEMLNGRNAEPEIDLPRYMRKLTDHAAHMWPPGERPRYRLEVAPVTLDLKRVLPLGMLVNELLTNTCKYGSPDGQAVTVDLAIERQGSGIRLTYRDSGPGCEAAHETASPRVGSYGSDLLQSLARQLRGTLVRGGGPGAPVELTFPLTLRGEAARAAA